MKAAQVASQPQQTKKGPRWRNILLIIGCILTLLLFIGAGVFWIGLVHNSASETLGAIFGIVGAIIGLISLFLALPPFLQYLQERRTASSLPPPAQARPTPSSPQQAANPAGIAGSNVQGQTAIPVGFAATVLQPASPVQASQSGSQITAGSGNLSQIRQLTQPEKDQLVRLLLACQAMKLRSSRNLIVQDLSFGDSIVRDTLITNTDDVMSIVDRCNNVPGGFQELVGRIEAREGNDNPVQRVKAFLNSLS